MKIILSRKGFDSSNGGCPSPILPDGTLLSLPIPDKHATGSLTYDDLQINGTTYSKIIHDLNPRQTIPLCHLDPDIRQDVRIQPIAQWQPAFGQCKASQSLLKNAGVDVGDIFLFFGWFRQTVLKNGNYQFMPRSPENFYQGSDLHIVYGYMEIGQIITDANAIKEYFWHPHAKFTDRPNALYLPSQTLTIDPAKPGYGTLDYRTDRVLTLENHTRSVWKAEDFLRPEHIVRSNRKNSAKSDGLYYAGIWQELVFNESEGLLNWVRNILK